MKDQKVTPATPATSTTPATQTTPATPATATPALRFLIHQFDNKIVNKVSLIGTHI